jgi:Tol biopolymer transport system component
MRRALATIAAAGLCLTGVVTGQQSDQAQRELLAASRTALLGDLPEAIRQYDSIAARYPDDRSVVATALIRMGDAYERLGDTESRRIYERIVREFDDQREIAALARTQLAAAAQSRPQGLVRLPLSGSGDYGFGAVTPDGRYLLSSGGMFDRVTGVHRERIADGDCSLYPVVFDLAISPDGRDVAYACEDAANPEFGSYELRTVAIGGEAGARSRVLLRSDEIVYFGPFGWSPDRRDVYALLTRRDGTHEIAAIAVATGAVRRLISLEWRWPEKLSLSPDGRHIAYDAPPDRDSPGRDILLVATDGSTHVPLVERAARDVRPVWTPDGRAVVFVSHGEGRPALWRIPVENGKPAGAPRQVRLLHSTLRPIGFTRDGAFYYLSWPFESGGIYSAEVDLVNGTVMRPPARAIERLPDLSFAPAYAPDGNSLAYFTRTGFSDFVSIVVRSLATGEEREVRTNLLLSEFGTGRFRADWLRDGSLVFVGRTNEGEPFMLQRVDLHTGRSLLPHRVEALSQSSVRASPDGGTIYYSRSLRRTERAVLAYDLATGRERELFRTPASPHSVAPSPDGQYVAFTLGPPPWDRARTEDSGLYLLPASGGDVRPLQIPPGTAGLWAIRWSTQGDAVLLQTSNGALWWSPVDGGAPRRVGSATMPAIEALHPDGRQIAIARRDATAPPEVWVDFDLQTAGLPPR